MFDSVKTILGMLEVSTEFAQNISFNRERIQRALPAGHLDATTLADYLVKKVNASFPYLKIAHDIFHMYCLLSPAFRTTFLFSLRINLDTKISFWTPKADGLIWVVCFFRG